MAKHMSQNARDYKNFLIHGDGNRWFPVSCPSNYLTNINKKTEKQRISLVNAFMPLFEQILEIPQDTSEYYANQQYYNIYWMAVSKMGALAYKNAIRHMKEPDVATEFKTKYSDEIYSILLAGNESYYNSYMINVNHHRFMYLYTNKHTSLIEQITDQTTGELALSGRPLERAIKNYFDENAPHDYWKVCLDITEIKRNIKQLAKQNSARCK